MIRISCHQLRVRSSDLLAREVLDFELQAAANAVERIPRPPAVAQGVLLDSATDLVQGLTAELDHGESIQHGGGLGKLVTDRVGLAVERVQCRGADPVGELAALSGQPVAVGSPGAALDQLQQRGPGAAVFVTGVIYDPGRQPGARQTDMRPKALIDPPQSVDPGEASWDSMSGVIAFQTAFQATPSICVKAETAMS